jgi:DNA-binding IclR family transcriptional regulator
MSRYLYFILVDGIGESPDSYPTLKIAQKAAEDVAKRTGKAVILKRWGGRRIVYIEIAKRA